MDGWLKTLIACACVVVIAGGGWYASGEYSDYRERTAKTDLIKRVRNELFMLASASESEPEKVRAMCSVIREKPDTFSDENFAARTLRNCKALGFI
ncbi:hypothetical protein [Sinorhizobium meliloti]|uniref:hypothetical protein n=1 Tax=Rhizobium meliloti TaxID=382 RepID=UPI003D651D53